MEEQHTQLDEEDEIQEDQSLINKEKSLELGEGEVQIDT